MSFIDKVTLMEEFTDIINTLPNGHSVDLIVRDKFDHIVSRESFNSRKIQVDHRKYGHQDADSEMLFKHFNEKEGSLVCEVGANEEYIGDILTDHGFRVIGVDLRDISLIDKNPSYIRIKDDFVQLAPKLSPCFDVMVSTSAIEHFGLQVYGQVEKIEDYDTQAVQWMFNLLKPGGSCYITVPFGKAFHEDKDWRVYDAESLQRRIILNFQVIEKVFFKSGSCICPDVDNIVTQEDADQYDGKSLPHVTILLHMKKPE